MSRKLRIKALLYCVVFGIVSMSAMLYVSANKKIVIADVAGDDVTSRSTSAEDAENQTDLLNLQRTLTQEEYLCIPIPEGMQAEQVKIENHYMDRQLWVILEDTREDFFDDKAVSGDLSRVVSATVEKAKGKLSLIFELTGVYECQSTLEKDQVYIEFIEPREMYDKILVVDAGHGGADPGFTGEGMSEKELTLDIAQRLKALLGDTDIKVYSTRREDAAEPTEEERIRLANAVGADFFVSIHTQKEEKASGIYGIEAYYDNCFFLPGFGNVEWADLLERQVVTKVSGKGLGLFPAEGEGSFLKEADMPAVLLSVGYMSNQREDGLLQNEDYRQCIAEGIYDAIMTAFEQQEMP